MGVINQIGTIFCTDQIGDVTVEKIRKALEVSGLDPKEVCNLSERYCFTRTKNILRAEGVVDAVSEDEQRWTWQLSEKYVQDNKLSYAYRAQFWFDKATQSIGADSLELTEKARELFAHYQVTYLTSDTSTLIKRIFEKQKGVLSLRRSGVVYFVPQEHLALLEKIQLFAKEIGAQVITAPIGADNREVREKTLASLNEAVRADLKKLVDELAELKAAGESLTPRKAKKRWQAVIGEIERIKTFGRSLHASTVQLLQSISTSEFDLALVADNDLDVIAALAHKGTISGALASIAAAAFEGDLPVFTSDRVQSAVCAHGLSAGEAPDVSAQEAFDLPVTPVYVQRREECLVEA